MNSTIEVTRQQLYDEVWSEPMTRLSKKYGLSDVGLAKVCKRHNIPRPPAGYWAKLAHGKKVRRIPLSKMDNETPIEFCAIFDNIGEEDPDLPQKVHALIEFELDPANKILVQARMGSPHPTTQKIRDKLQSGEVDYYKRINSLCSPQIWVSKHLIPRALLVMDTLIKTLDKRNFTDGIFDQSVSYGIFEILDSELSERAKKRILETGQTRRSESDYDRKPSGRLKLEVMTGMTFRGDGVQRNWCDGKVQRIENCLNDFICGLIRWAAIEREQTLEWARWESEREERDRIAREKAAEEAACKARINRLYEDAGNWTEARQLRKYIAAVALTNPRKESKKDLDEWVRWAHAEANRIDPFCST